MIARALLRSQPDHRLVELAAAGSDPAFATLVTRHRRLLDATARRVLLPSAAAEDAVQSALLAAWEALQRGVVVRDPASWLVGIARNHALQARRGSSYGFAELHEALAGGALPEEELLRRTEIRETLAGLAALPERQRDALLRTAVDGASHEEAARAMHTDVGAIRNLVFRARTTLRTSMGALVPGPAIVWAARASVGSWSTPPGASDGVLAGAAVAGGATFGVKAATAVVAVGALGALGGTALTARPDRDPARAHAAAAPSNITARPAVRPAAALREPATTTTVAARASRGTAVATHAGAPAQRAALRGRVRRVVVARTGTGRAEGSETRGGRGRDDADAAPDREETALAPESDGAAESQPTAAVAPSTRRVETDSEPSSSSGDGAAAAPTGDAAPATDLGDASADG